jgi:hypothetical protein
LSLPQIKKLPTASRLFLRLFEFELSQLCKRFYHPKVNSPFSKRKTITRFLTGRFIAHEVTRTLERVLVRLRVIEHFLLGGAHRVIGAEYRISVRLYGHNPIEI